VGSCSPILVALVSKSSLERLSFAATAVTPVIVVLTGLLVIDQIREASTGVRTQLFDNTSSRILELTNIFIEHPQLRPYFYAGVDIEDADQVLGDQVLAVAEIHADFFDTELLRQHTFHRSLKDLPDFDSWIKGMLRTSPALCRFLNEDLERGEDAWYDRILTIYKDQCSKGDVAWPRSERPVIVTEYIGE
jgi:hypothetical protein